MENDKKQKLLKVCAVICAGIGLLSLVLFVPAVKNLIIDMGERYTGHTLKNPDKWVKKINETAISCCVIFWGLAVYLTPWIRKSLACAVRQTGLFFRRVFSAYCGTASRVWHEALGIDAVFYALVCIMGTLVFCMIYGVRVLNPCYTDWLMAGGDLSQHYLGWVSFRASPWMFPLGMTRELSWPVPVSVIFTDSIPLLAVFFKLFRAALPTQFQYFGLWGIASFALQAFFAARILDRLTKNRTVTFVGAILFTLSPVMIWRMYAHTALAGHWILLMALDVFFTKDMTRKKAAIFWTALGALCPAIHFFFTGMCAIILAGFCVRRTLSEKDRRSAFLAAAVPVCGYLAGAVFVTALLGGFSSKKVVDAAFGGLGYYSMNLNAFCNPQGWSRFLKDLPRGPGQYEGFAYLGAGFLLLAVMAATLFCVKSVTAALKEQKAMAVSVSVMFVLALLAAASNVIMLNGRTLVRIPMPFPIEFVWSIFRGSGRFAWICCYLIMTTAIAMLTKNAHARFAMAALVLALAVQSADLSGVLSEKHKYFSAAQTYTPPVTNDAAWQDLVKSTEWTHLYLTKGVELPVLYDFAALCLANGKTMNRFYFAHGNGAIFDKNVAAALESRNSQDLFVFPPNDEETVRPPEMRYYRIGEYTVGTFGFVQFPDENLLYGAEE